jgi:hypothetical protein
LDIMEDMILAPSFIKLFSTTSLNISREVHSVW